ncbi:MAG: DUF192 domain-containing protein [Endomicrobia bacterium]|nr:DUF192 domain-containing protein [Endomicrobiia bacterium]
MNNFLKIAAVFSMLTVSAGCVFAQPEAKNKAKAFDKYNDGDTLAVSMAGKRLNLFTAKSGPAQEQGLSYRKEVPEDGMIFLFDATARQVFWMKDMNFPIDIIWIASDKVVGMAENAAPEPNTAQRNLRQYYSPENVNIVVELKAGEAKRLGIKTGSLFTILGDKK